MTPSSREITSPRPTPLKIHKDSHLIQKFSSSSLTTTTTTTASSSSNSSSATSGSQGHHPVIIYTHSPKIIHTQACDFMTLVQKLTGLSRSPDHDNTAAPPTPGNNNAAIAHHKKEEPAGSSTENSSNRPAAASVGFNTMLPDNPRLKPGSASEFLCPPRSTIYRYSAQPAISHPMSNVGGNISPSILESIMTFPDFS